MEPTWKIDEWTFLGKPRATASRDAEPASSLLPQPGLLAQQGDLATARKRATYALSRYGVGGGVGPTGPPAVGVGPVGDGEVVGATDGGDVAVGEAGGVTMLVGGVVAVGAGEWVGGRERSGSAETVGAGAGAPTTGEETAR